MVAASGVVLAAGRGTRFGGEEGKVWAPLARRPLLAHALGAFVCARAVDEIVVVVRSGDEARAAAVARGLSLPTRVVVGGERRLDSARAGVTVASGELVLVHDGARPLANPDLVRRVLTAARRHGAAVPVVPVSDTVRYAKEGFLAETLDRSGLVLIQTPQGFQRELLLAGYAEAERRGLDLPDDAAAVLLLGRAVAAVPGDPANLKVTRPEDLILAERLLPSPR
ncbi:2-C-methyl-D-erythritol 4-phosphate cytidylyltransferase [Candidatus Bipolaricaulota bacterium]|nr:2-C-methyl-D-erythritol 4-phosphate cytidylyltransferase [Candidatus Bipolaricaulota bacterium]